MQEKRKFPRFPVTNPVLCFRYGRQVTMRAQNISLGGMKLEANLDLKAGESLDFDILADGTRIHCKGRILAIEDFKDRVQARLCFTPTADSESRKLSDFLRALSRPHWERWVIVGLVILSSCIAYLIIRTYVSG